MSISNTIDDAIHSQGYCIIDHFLDATVYDHLRTTLKELYQDGAFKPAKIGQKTQENHAPTIRNDQIYWLDETMPNRAVEAYFQQINTIRDTLNQSLFLGLNSIEAHFAVYQPGSFYKKHVDQFSTTLDRRISCVYYLNNHWSPEHGGELALYHQPDKPHINIEPLGNRLVCFKSDLPHEVSTTHQTRFSIAGWLKVRAMSA